MWKCEKLLKSSDTHAHPHTLYPLLGVCVLVCVGVCEVDLLHDISIVRQTAGRELSLAITTTRSCTCSQGRKTLRKQRQCTTMRGRRVQRCRGQGGVACVTELLRRKCQQQLTLRAKQTHGKRRRASAQNNGQNTRASGLLFPTHPHTHTHRLAHFCVTFDEFPFGLVASAKRQNAV